MKKIAIILVITLCFGLMAPLASATGAESRYYSDVYLTDSYHDAVIYLYEHELMTGTTGATDTVKALFSPNNALLRGQIVAILWRMLNRANPNGTVTYYDDCDPDHFFYDAVLWASSSNVGVINGHSDGTFRPFDVVVQEQLLAMLYRFACHCGYASNTSTVQNYYIRIFNNSSLRNKTSFSDYAKAAVGWACDTGVLTNNDVNGLDPCSRADIAEYIYTFYQLFQKKYGLSVINTDGMAWVIPCGPAMQTLFTHYGASPAIDMKDITSAEFEAAMQSAFGNAKGLDICYLYCASHGSTSGLGLFTGSPHTLTPTRLRELIDQYNGTFVVFVSGCYSGTYISTGTESNEADSDDVFDADSFVAALLTNTDDYEVESDLRNGERIKVLCSSMKNEKSYATDRFATNYWCLGSGYNKATNTFGSLYADENNDFRVSLYELYSYSHDEIKDNLIDHTQTVVVYPENDNYIIFESDY